ncbi:MAG: tRNA (adenosine(37)-N6)-threonylcarbamoyltransferase complex transferase subunit TsaD [Candidatus Yanofskybacteria bacterium RIFCSPHIGHO2_01_FULL_42_12]|nr:MAG: tRNA (adenosine(37)-N6)-threonylcarbamoyltransferase complex transferase subunit TsaD [Candidatus Yanofskybacteria bacterium RIFCSPHIGHO2_01_FULL_42_12]
MAMIILGAETSCDETAIAILEIKNSKIKVLSNVVSSQIKLHAKFGGVVPNLAAREHVKNIGHVFKLALKKSQIKINDIDLMAVTRGPGLGPSLLVGLAFTRTIAWKYDKPLVGVNHLEGHIYSNWLKPTRVNSKFKIQNKDMFPILNLIVSGGHTELVLMQDHGKYKIIGETLDDAVGEAFDKVARLLGLSYPGGPAIAQRASQWKLETLNSKSETISKFKIPNSKPLRIEFPRPMIKSKNYDFSYSGLKTAVLYKVRDLKTAGVKITDDIVNEICYEFQNAALDVLIYKTIKAVQEYKAPTSKNRGPDRSVGIKSIFLSGGVSANKELRKRLETEAKKIKIKYSQPEMEYTGDNAAMIAIAGFANYQTKENNPALSKKGGARKDFSWKSVKMDANLGF